jgi:hypothetical protein
MLKTDQRELCDSILNVQISNVETFLDVESWNIFKVVYGDVFCDEFCLADIDKTSIECENCNHWYHLLCAKLGPNYVRCTDMQWLCHKCS